MKKTTITLLSCFISTLLLSGCASVDSKLEREFQKISRGPKGAPFKSITNFSAALQCMDGLMLANNIKNIPVLIEDIDDKTEEIKTGTRDMLISAVSQMTAQSKGIKLIAYGKDSSNLISFMKAANYDSAYKSMPVYDIQGSITQFDKGVARADASLGMFARRQGGGGMAHSSSLDVIALDLNVLHAADLSVVPGVSSRNSVAVFQRGDSLNTDASINKLGVYFDLNLNASEGKAQALRNLVELAAIEIIGKLTKVPYTECLLGKPVKTIASSLLVPVSQPVHTAASTTEVAEATQRETTTASAQVTTAQAAPTSMPLPAPRPVTLSKAIFTGDSVVRVKRTISTEVLSTEIID